MMPKDENFRSRGRIRITEKEREETYKWLKTIYQTCNGGHGCNNGRYPVCGKTGCGIYGLCKEWKYMIPTSKERDGGAFK